MSGGDRAAAVRDAVADVLPAAAPIRALQSIGGGYGLANWIGRADGTMRARGAARLRTILAPPPHGGTA